ncbi:MAG: sugar phosphate nucleotidyltransferase [Bacteroidales bacterium]
MKKTAFIFAAGMGTRLKPLTDNKPKALVEYHGKPMLENLLDKMVKLGYQRVIINTYHFASMIKDFVENQYQPKFKKQPLEILLSDESDLLRDTGGGLKHAAHFFDCNYFLAHNVDIDSDIDLNELHAKYRGELACLIVSPRPTSRYLIFDHDMRLRAWINEKTGEVKSAFPELAKLNIQEILNLKNSGYQKLAFSGIHLISTEVFKLMDNYQERFSIIDFYLEQSKDHIIRGISAPNNHILDLGKISLFK